MSGLMHTVIWFIVALGVLITVHEFGHFWVARKLGVKVLRFSVGFGRPLWSRRFGEDRTEFVLAALPLGGYVKMLDEHEGRVRPEEQHRAFNRQSLGVRTAVVCAGPAFNFLFAILVYWMIFMTGDTGTRPVIGEVTEGSVAAAGGFAAGDLVTEVDGNPVVSWENLVMVLVSEQLEARVVNVQVRTTGEQLAVRRLDLSSGDEVGSANFLSELGLRPYRPVLPAVLGKLTADGAAESAGLLPGDRIVRADGTDIEDWVAWVDYVRERPDTAIVVEVDRKDVLMTFELVPRGVANGGQRIGRIGAYVDVPDDLLDESRVEVQYGPVDSLGRAIGKTADMSVLMLKMLGGMIFGRVSVDNISGPISIAQFAGESARVGWLSFVKFLAVVSISLGVLNLLPVPVLDGGHLLFYLVEFVKGSPLSEAAQAVGQRIGIVLLLLLMSVAFYQDIDRLLGG